MPRHLRRRMRPHRCKAAQRRQRRNASQPSASTPPRKARHMRSAKRGHASRLRRRRTMRLHLRRRVRPHRRGGRRAIAAMTEKKTW